METSPKIVVAVLAGGAGTRLFPLTKNRAKPGVPFGGKYRIIDFALASAMNSGYRKIYVMLQYASRSLHHHIQRVWHAQTGRDEFVEGMFPKMRHAAELKYVGTADAIYQNWEEITPTDDAPDLIVVLSGDHVFKIDIRQVVKYHLEKESDFTICATRVPTSVASKQLGVLVVDEHYRVIGFEEKPEKPTEIPGDPGFCLGSMGNYIFPTELGGQILRDDASCPDSQRDFGKNIIPKIIHELSVYAYPYETNVIDGEVAPKWTDVGTIRSFFEACMDLCHPTPMINLYNIKWPIATGAEDHTAPFKDVPRRLVASGSCIINEATLWYVVMHKYAVIGEGAKIDHCVIMDDSIVGNNVRMKNTIVDKHIVVPDNTSIGYNMEEDKARGFTVEEYKDGWISILPEHYTFS